MKQSKKKKNPMRNFCSPDFWLQACITSGITPSLSLCRSTEKQLSTGSVGEAREKKICGEKETQRRLGEQQLRKKLKHDKKSKYVPL